ncbi:MAG: hypothetical protein M0Z43_00385, partial [Acidithiobacillus sp.]|nr:hypothetical protein [Acidithiobacillus sp.]
NSPYAYPQRHWELDEQGQPTQRKCLDPDGRPLQYQRQPIGTSFWCPILAVISIPDKKMALGMGS